MKILHTESELERHVIAFVRGIVAFTVLGLLFLYDWRFLPFAVVMYAVGKIWLPQSSVSVCESHKRAFR